jgi:hypothetical protein
MISPSVGWQRCFGAIVGKIQHAKRATHLTPMATRNESRQRKARPAERSRGNRLGGPGRLAKAAGASNELPDRKALTARLETQRTELLRAMSCVSLARRTIEEHAADDRHHSGIDPDEEDAYRERVLAALQDARDALAIAYPILERIAEALDVEELLAGAAKRDLPSAKTHGAVRSSRKEPRRGVVG